MTRRRYTQEYKKQAVMLTYGDGKSIQQVAMELGIAANMLHRWRHEYEASAGDGVFPGSGHARDEEMVRLRKALKQAEMERDVLKKAVAFFAQTPN